MTFVVRCGASLLSQGRFALHVVGVEERLEPLEAVLAGVRMILQRVHRSCVDHIGAALLPPADQPTTRQ